MAGNSFDYFDGRGDAHDHYHEWEEDAVEVEMEDYDVTLHGGAHHRESVTLWVEPPHRYLYPRPVESAAEARTLYLADEITIYQFEDYLEKVLENAK